MRIAVWGDFSGRAGRDAPAGAQELLARRGALADFDEFDDLVDSFSPRARVSLADETFEFEFRELDDFLPDAVFRQCPRLEDLVDPRDRSGPNEAATALLRQILAHGEFRGLEARWRGVEWLLRRVYKDKRVQVVLWDVTAAELAADLASNDDLTQTAAYARMVGEVERDPDAKPWGLTLALWDFEFSARDADLAGRLARIAARARTPVVASISAAVFGDDFDPPADAKAAWEALRALPEAHYLSLASPGFLLRPPYGDNYKQPECFAFEEFSAGGNSYVFGSAALAIGCLVAQAFAKQGWNCQPGSILFLEGMPIHSYRDANDEEVSVTSERRFTSVVGQERVEQGLSPLVSFRGRDRIEFSTIRSVAGPALAGLWSDAAPGTGKAAAPTGMPGGVTTAMTAEKSSSAPAPKRGGEDWVTTAPKDPEIDDDLASLMQEKEGGDGGDDDDSPSDDDDDEDSPSDDDESDSGDDDAEDDLDDAGDDNGADDDDSDDDEDAGGLDDELAALLGDDDAEDDTGDDDADDAEDDVDADDDDAGGLDDELAALLGDDDDADADDDADDEEPAADDELAALLGDDDADDEADAGDDEADDDDEEPADDLDADDSDADDSETDDDDDEEDSETDENEPADDDDALAALLNADDEDEDEAADDEDENEAEDEDAAADDDETSDLDDDLAALLGDDDADLDDKAEDEAEDDDEEDEEDEDSDVDDEELADEDNLDDELAALLADDAPDSDDDVAPDETDEDAAPSPAAIPKQLAPAPPSPKLEEPPMAIDAEEPATASGAPDTGDIATLLTQAQAATGYGASGSAVLLDFASLLQPVHGDEPAGEGVPFATREQLEQARKEVNPDSFSADDPMRPEEPVKADWPTIISLAQETLQSNAKNLLVAARLLEALAKQHGFAGVRDGLHLMRLLVEVCWHRLEPMLEDEDDLEVRAAPFNWIDDPDRGALFPVTLRATPVVHGAGLSLGLLDWSEVQAGKSALGGDAIDRAVSGASRASCQTMADDLRQASAELRALVAALQSRMANEAPGLANVRAVIEEARKLSEQILQRKADDEPIEEPGDASSGGADGESGGGTGGGGGPRLNTREGVYRQLREAAEALARMEPHSPVPFLIQRAVTLGALPFPEMIRLLIRDVNVLSEMNRELGIKGPEENQY